MRISVWTDHMHLYCGQLYCKFLGGSYKATTNLLQTRTETIVQYIKCRVHHLGNPYLGNTTFIFLGYSGITLCQTICTT